MGTTPNPADVEDGLDQVGNLESALEPMPTFTSVNPAPCRVGSPHAGFYRSTSNQANQNRHLSGDVQRSVACEAYGGIPGPASPWENFACCRCPLISTSRPTEGFITPTVARLPGSHSEADSCPMNPLSRGRTCRAPWSGNSDGTGDDDCFRTWCRRGGQRTPQHLAVLTCTVCLGFSCRSRLHHGVRATAERDRLRRG